MSQFKKNLERLPSIDHLVRLEIVVENQEEPLVIIENKPGKSGSLAVYHYLYNEFGRVSPESAVKGLELFGEYTEEAKTSPGSHPNIDFLFKVIEAGDEYQIDLVER